MRPSTPCKSADVWGGEGASGLRRGHALGHDVRGPSLELTLLRGETLSSEVAEQRPPGAGRFTRLHARDVQQADTSSLSPHEA